MRLDKAKVMRLISKEMMEESKAEITYNTTVSFGFKMRMLAKVNIKITTKRYELLIGLGKIKRDDPYKFYSVGRPELIKFYKSMISSLHDLINDEYKKEQGLERLRFVKRRDYERSKDTESRESRASLSS